MSCDLEKLSKHLHDTTPDRLAEKEIMENAEAIKAALERGESYQLKSVPLIIRRPVAAPTGTGEGSESTAHLYIPKAQYAAKVTELNAENAALRSQLATAQALIARLEWILKQTVTDLPSKRDWLDPQLEAEARAALAEIAELRKKG